MCEITVRQYPFEVTLRINNDFRFNTKLKIRRVRSFYRFPHSYT